ncbi:MAG: peptide chain release factor-like protein [Phycisphaeraceae bacterium]|nr:peptide chain release factor-like protein [Phycisphaeraceae bacterium]
MPSPYLHPAALPVEQLLTQCKITRGRASGPGGQHRNKVETAIDILHKPTGLEAFASERRSQEENRRMAVFRLRVKLAIEFRSWLDRDHQPTPLWQSRCRDGAMRVNPKHEDFPAVLAEALDLLATRRYDPKVTARILGCTASQLVKLIKAEPAALEKVNQERKERKLHALK